MTSSNQNNILPKLYKVYSVENYSTMKQKDFDDNKIELSIQELSTELLENNNHYHFRIHPNTQYIFFGDIDHYNQPIETFRDKLKVFLKDEYSLEFTDDDFKYTKNNGKDGSFHYSIPKWYLTTEKLKEIHNHILKKYKTDFIIKLNKREIKVIDTSIYSEHWFRCPNQSKGDNKKDNTLHQIITGDIKDFIIDYIPDTSICITDVHIINTTPTSEPTANATLPIPDTQVTTTTPQDIFLSNILTNSKLYKELFDKCYKQFRFDNYQEWISVGMAIKNTIKDENEALELFIHFSSKGNNYNKNETIKKYNSFKTMTNGLTARTLYKMAYEDNKDIAIKIISFYKIHLSPTEICEFIKVLDGDKYIYKIVNNIYKLYCYNGQYWVNNSILFKKYISTTLFDFLRELVCDFYWNQRNDDFIALKRKIDRLQTITYKNEIIETYKEYNATQEIDFDNKWWLFGFNNKVYDLKEYCFRDYIYDDYVSITCGYDWIEPTEEEITTVESIIDTIMPNEDDKTTLLEILATGLDGRCLENFCIFNGSGRNGKGLIDDMVLEVLGNYGMIGNSNLLFEVSKMGSNPEKANIHKKRLVIFREPPRNKKFQNSIIKELTGGGKISARGHFESDTEKVLNNTTICECNDKPLFAEELTNADVQRIKDIQFISGFTKDKELLDVSKHIYLANDFYKTAEFRSKYKYALFKILIKYHKRYTDNNCTIELSESVKINTQKYLEQQCDIVQWFKENYTKDEEGSETVSKIRVSDVFEHFKQSEYYFDLPKKEKEKYTKLKFFSFIQNNIFFRRYYEDRDRDLGRNILKQWSITNEIDI